MVETNKGLTAEYDYGVGGGGGGGGGGGEGGYCLPSANSTSGGCVCS